MVSPLLVLVGPTASGKSSLALHLAQHFNGEIISCDSVAIYRDMEIGTAKPSHAERALVPHHLIDVVTPDQPHCSSDDRSSTYIAKLPAGQSYPIGCTVNYVGARDDIGGDCKLEQVCKCALPGLIVPAVDGGVDDSGVIAPAPTGTGNAVWQCG